MNNAVQSIVAAAVAIAFLAGCGNRSEPEPSSSQPTHTIMTTFYPTTYFAQRIAGDVLTVTNPVPPDADPIFWQPSDAQIAQYQAADLIIINGAEFEKWVKSAVLPQSRIVDTCENLDLPFITYETTTHSHGPGGEHTHMGIDGHTWLDPMTAMAQARAIVEALAERYPDHADDFRANAEPLMSDLAGLDTRWRDLAPRLGQVTLLASHPAYNYVARRYELEISNLDLDPEAPLDTHQIGSIRHAIEHAPSDRAVVLLWEGAALQSTIDQLSNDMDIASVWISPAESLDPDAGDDYLAIMHANLDRLDAALR